MLMDPELLKWGLSQGALAIVLLVIIAWWRSDYRRFQVKDEEKITLLISIIKENTESNTILSERLDELIKAK